MANRVIRGRDPATVYQLFVGVLRFRKTALARAQQMSEPFTVDTPEGRMDGEAGDYLVSDEQMTHCWPVKKHIFESTYEVMK